ncbi:hypothetical protein ACFVT5_41350 [Streptomyces sp. NPDC058001]|uniref:hypothetical protein n=1 Tax=Streptomyces sp. NPDC058001 TaxID=3346300 RepID=UPI0036E08C99
MPIMTDAAAGSIVGVLPAFDGLMVQVSAPSGTDTTGVPPGGGVVGWVLVSDPETAGGARVDPVFLADGRAWTPDQYRAAYGQQFTFRVDRAH